MNCDQFENRMQNLNLIESQKPSEVTVQCEGGLSDLLRAVSAFTKIDIKAQPFENKKANAFIIPRPSEFLAVNGQVLLSDLAIGAYLWKLAQSELNNPLHLSEVEFWMAFVSSSASWKDDQYKQVTAFLNHHLQMRTYFVAHALSYADLVLWATLKHLPDFDNGSRSRNVDVHHLLRWFAFIESLPEISSLFDKKNEAGQGSFDVALPGASKGNCCTRFPPEPSGYMHIGHAKAALLNNYFARKYNGRLIIRFDDTNPSKEKQEFQDNILEDLKRLNIKGDFFSYTSDYFEQFIQAARDLIKFEKGYMDDTLQEQMREERMEGIESKHRNNSVAVNMERFEEMLSGSAEGQRWCLRGKIDMQCLNKAMRDPVFFRSNLTPHHRTGSKYKAYPTYDFACPLVDSWEGVTHAMRTTEYHDRNEQYFWVCDALGIRKPHIFDYSRLNLVNTVLSKRKLQWFVDEGLVNGWTDPRFPTVQGVLRHGLTVEAMLEFILDQGASRRINFQDWASLWAINKRVLDPVAPRYVALTKNTAVPLALSNGPATPYTEDILKHKKNKSLGTKKTWFAKTILLEGQDAAEVEQGEEVTLMDWGNCFIHTINRNEKGEVVALNGELHQEGDVKKTKKKLTWLADVPENKSDARLVELGYLITKAKLEEGDSMENYINRDSWKETEVIGDMHIKTLQKGDKIQLERRGFFICDEPSAASTPALLIYIPDGKVKSSASVGGTKTK
eukprot:GCRY01000933.1.p1 GENE.GCRY01000933.1~~GCRY01000933.1.p1  ORF type:complete len:730 (-),score=139.01 GCRY01000933.1:383-2572(-)